jgi:hypothetical protein
MDPDLDLNLTKNHKKIRKLISMTLKIHESYIFMEKL